MHIEDEILGFWKVEDEIRVLDSVFGTYKKKKRRRRRVREESAVVCGKWRFVRCRIVEVGIFSLSCLPGAFQGNRFPDFLRRRSQPLGY